MLSLLTFLLVFEIVAAAVVPSTSPNPRAVLEKRRSVSGTAVVYLGANTGTPQHLASGFIYGIPDTAKQIPDHFYTDIGFNFGRAGGAQTPATGWLGGEDQYVVREHCPYMTIQECLLIFLPCSLGFSPC